MNSLLHTSSVTKTATTLAVFVASLIFGNVTIAQSDGFIKPVAPISFAESPSSAKTISWHPFTQDEETQPNADVKGQDEEQDDQSDDPALQSEEKPITKWPPKPLSEIRIDIRNPDQEVPRDRVQDVVFENWNEWTAFQPGLKVFAWAAPNIRYQPLYFEDVALERYGQAHGDLVQFAASSVHFFKSAVFLPYAMLVDHPRSCDYPLGYCRPGDVVPATKQKFWYGWHHRR